MPYAIRIHERCPNCGEDLAKWDPPEDEPPAPAVDGLTHQHVGPRGTVTCDYPHAEPPHDLVLRSPEPAEGLYDYLAEDGWIVENDGDGCSQIVATNVMPSFGRWVEAQSPAPAEGLRAEIERLCVSWHTAVPVDILRAALVLPPAPAEGLDVERLARALAAVYPTFRGGRVRDWDDESDPARELMMNHAAAIASEYAALEGAKR